MTARLIRALGLALALNLVFVAPASAYIDAGSTAVIFQAVVAGIAAAGVSISMFWGRIRNFFSRDDGDDALASTEATPNADA